LRAFQDKRNAQSERPQNVGAGIVRFCFFETSCDAGNLAVSAVPAVCGGHRLSIRIPAIPGGL